jgi:hypothetical protein
MNQVEVFLIFFIGFFLSFSLNNRFFMRKIEITLITKKKAILRGFLFHLAGVYNLHELFCGSLKTAA